MLCVHFQEGPLDIISAALVVFITRGRKVKYIMRLFEYLRFLGSLKFRSGYRFKWNFSSGGKCSDIFFPLSFLIFMQVFLHQARLRNRNVNKESFSLEISAPFLQTRKISVGSLSSQTPVCRASLQIWGDSANAKSFIFHYFP